MAKILVAGLDGSFANFGVARMSFDLDMHELAVENLVLTSTRKTDIKTVRNSSDIFRRAQEVFKGAFVAAKGCQVAFAEIPYGGKDYNAVLGFGITIGVYAAIASRVPIVEVTQREAKKAAVGTYTASKQEMIDWAFETYPNAPWLLTKRKGVMVPTLANEHLADACAIVHAGIKTPQFKQVCSILSAAAKAA